MNTKPQTPQIRFTGFSEDWETDVFENIFYYERPDKYIVRSKEYSPTKPTPVLTANKSFILGYTDESSTYNKPSIIFDDFTLENRYIDFPYMVKSSALKILTTKYNYNLRFAHELLKSTKFEVIGHARHYISIVQPKEVLVPIEQEQAAIGNLFQNIDQTIALQRRKHQQTQTLKKSLLSKMFPQKGQQQPEIRLAGFIGNWKEVTLDDFGSTVSGTSLESEFSKTGKYKVISIGSYSENSKYTDQGIRVPENEKTTKKLLSKNDLAMILNDKTLAGNIIGRVLLIDEDNQYVFNQRTQQIIVNQEKYIPQFLYHMLNADDIRRKVVVSSQGNTQIYVNWSSIKKLNYLIPNSKEEQTAIGQFFKQLDDTLSLQAKQLKTLDHLKQALLAKMFV